jgi:hypothetical protein
VSIYLFLYRLYFVDNPSFICYAPLRLIRGDPLRVEKGLKGGPRRFFLLTKDLTYQKKERAAKGRTSGNSISCLKEEQ